jgi:hypothetical protein
MSAKGTVSQELHLASEHREMESVFSPQLACEGKREGRGKGGGREEGVAKRRERRGERGIEQGMGKGSDTHAARFLPEPHLEVQVVLARDGEQEPLFCRTTSPLEDAQWACLWKPTVA